MSREDMMRYLQDPLVLGIVAAVAVVVIGLVLVLLLRGGKRKAAQDSDVRTELVAREREAQFVSAAEQLQFLTDPVEVVSEVSRIFREYLGMPLLAIYAGRDRDGTLRNILIRDGSTGEGDEGATALPESIPASAVPESVRPRITALSSLTPTSTVAGADSATGEPAPGAGGPGVALIPWQGPFEWRGALVAGANDSLSAEALTRYRNPLSRISDRLAVALELARGREKAEVLSQRTQSAAGFYGSLIKSLDEPTPLASIAREVAGLMKADSAALWRVEHDTSMVRMVAAFGLKSAEFLPLPFGQGLAGGVAESGRPLALEDAPSDPRCLFPREARESGIGSYLGAPVIYDGHTTGVIEVHTAQPHAWSEVDVETLQTNANVIGQLLKSTEARGSRLKVESAYLGLSEALQRLRSRDEVLEAAVEVLGHALGVSRALVVELDDGGRPAPVKHEYLMPDTKSAIGATFSDQTFDRVSAAVSGGEPIAISDSREGSLMDPEAANILQVLSEMVLPIRVQGKTRSFVYLHQCDRVRQWQGDEVEFADRVTRQLSLSLANLNMVEAASRSTGDAASKSSDNDKKLAELEKMLGEARSRDAQWRAMVEGLRAAEAEARASAEALRRSEAELRKERDQIREDEARVRRSSQQLLEINRLKSEFIVNAGYEIESSLQSVMGHAELLEQGAYGILTAEQLQAARSIYSNARRIKGDVDSLIEYGSTRSRRLERSGDAG